MKNVTFKRVENQSLPNLYSGTINGEIVGFIYKPTDTKSDRNAWRSYVGVGDMNDAMEAVQLAVK
jgi:hypothetical protein